LATDGSKSSNVAYEMVTESLFRTGDFLVISHIYSREKSYLPRNL